MTKQSVDEAAFETPPPAKYDSIVREGSYMMRHTLAAFDASLGINIKPGASAEDQARAEYGEVLQAVTHTRNVLRSLAARRDQLGDALEVVERPRMAAVEEGQRRMIAPTDADPTT